MTSVDPSETVDRVSVSPGSDVTPTDTTLHTSGDLEVTPASGDDTTARRGTVPYIVIGSGGLIDGLIEKCKQHYKL